MGSTVSVANTPFGKSLMGNIYITKVPVAFGYCMYDKKYVIRDWEDKPILANPLAGEFWVKVDSRLKFIIVGVDKRWSIDAGTNVSLHIKLLDNIPINENTLLVQAVDTNRHFGDWRLENALLSNNTKFTKLLSGDNELQVKELKCDIYYFEFFKEKIFEEPQFDKENMWYDREKLQLIGKNEEIIE